MLAPLPYLKFILSSATATKPISCMLPAVQHSMPQWPSQLVSRLTSPHAHILTHAHVDVPKSADVANPSRCPPSRRLPSLPCGHPRHHPVPAAVQPSSPCRRGLITGSTAAGAAAASSLSSRQATATSLRHVLASHQAAARSHR